MAADPSPDVASYFALSKSGYGENGMDPATEGYIHQQTSIRVKDPIRSLDFYVKKLGYHLICDCPFPQYKFTAYYIAYLPAGKETKMQRMAVFACLVGVATASITVSRTVNSLPSWLSASVTVEGSACTGSDKYGSNDCTLDWNTAYTINYTFSLTTAQQSGTVSADLKIDGLIPFKPSCKTCGENCTLTVPIIGKNFSFYPGDCPVPVENLSNATSVTLPAAPSGLPKTSVKGTVSLTDATGATVASGSVDASVSA